MARQARPVRLLAAFLVAALALAACATSGGGSAPSKLAASLGLGEVPLPTPDFVNNPSNLCAGVGLDATLVGDRQDAALTWIVDNQSQTRRDAVWPPGYRARFTPMLEVLDASGSLVLRNGDLIRGACGQTTDGRVYLAPPFE